jgi:hypothetical protein
MTAQSATDRSVGLGLLFSLAAVAAAVATGVFGYESALAHGGNAGSAQLLSGVAFGLAVLVGVVAIVAVHVYAE